MINAAQKRVFSLSGADIDFFSDWLGDVQTGLGVERHNRTRVRFLMEEILLRMRERFGEDILVEASIDRHLGRPRLRVEIACDPYNPLGGVEKELGDWESSLCTIIGLAPQYSYEHSRNVLKLVLPRPGMNPVIRIAIAIALGLLFGMAGAAIMPVGMRQVITNVVLKPTYDMWSRILNAVSGPIIFLTVVTTMLNTRSIDERGGNSALVIVGYFVLSFAVVTIALACAVPLFRLDHTVIQLSAELMYSLLDTLLRVVPSNIFEPFVEASTSQLLFLAFTLGFALIGLGSRADTIKQLVREANAIGMQFAEWVSWFVPIFTGAFLCLELWQGRTGILVDLWQPLITSLLISMITMALMILFTSQIGSVSPLLLVRKIWKPFQIALRSGSLDASFGEAQLSCTNLLGIDKNFAKVGLPQGLVLYMPISAVGTIVFTLFVAREEGVQSSSLWYLSAIVMSVVVFVATPPVPGANLLAYVVLFSILKIPVDALLDAMIFDIVFGIFAGAGNQAVLQLEMVRQANHFGLLNKEKLRRPM